MPNTVSSARVALPLTASPEGTFEPDSAWWQTIFAVIDARDAAGFVAIASCRHRLIRTWGGSSDVACEGEVTYLRHDGAAVTVPFANVFELRGSRIAGYRIFIDNSPLFS